MKNEVVEMFFLWAGIVMLVAIYIEEKLERD